MHDESAMAGVKQAREGSAVAHAAHQALEQLVPDDVSRLVEIDGHQRRMDFRFVSSSFVFEAGSVTYRNKATKQWKKRNISFETPLRLHA